MAFIDENPDAKDPSAVVSDKPDSKSESQNDSESVSGGGDVKKAVEENVESNDKVQGKICGIKRFSTYSHLRVMLLPYESVILL